MKELAGGRRSSSSRPPRRWRPSACRSTEAAGRVAAEEGRSAVDLPPFDRSAMDGYAVRAADTSGRRAAAGRRDRRGRGARRRRSSRAPRSASPPARRSRRAPTRCCSRSWPRLNGGSVRATEALERRHAHPRPRRGRPRRRPDRARRRAADARAGLLARRRRRRRDRRPPPRAAAPPRHRLGAAAARRAAGAGQDPRVQRPDGAAAGRARRRAGDRPRRDRRRLRVHPRRGRGRAWRGDVLVVSGGVSRRPARPRQARLRGLRRRGGVLARAREARQAAVVRPPRRHARVRPPRQPALEHRRLPRLHRARPAPPARRARRRDAHRAGAADRAPPARPTAAPPSSPRGSRPGADGVLRGDADRQPGLAPHRRARAERRLRRSPPTAPARWPPARPSTPCGLSSWRESDFRERDRPDPAALDRARHRRLGDRVAAGPAQRAAPRRRPLRSGLLRHLPDLRGGPPVDQLRRTRGSGTRRTS